MNTEQQIEKLKKQIDELNKNSHPPINLIPIIQQEIAKYIGGFGAMVVMLRLQDGKVYPVTLFAKIASPEIPTFEVVSNTTPDEKH